jgi:hypothetical protein
VAEFLQEIVDANCVTAISRREHDASVTDCLHGGFIVARANAAKLLTVALLALTLTACAGDQTCRPCGPGYLNNALVPQGCAGADFRDACRAHDQCYGTDCPRECCDQQFYEELCAACECSEHPALCRLRAWHWYVQVRLLGGPGYQQSQAMRCDGCGCEQPH